MSWSIGVAAWPSDTASDKLKEQVAQWTCPEPEESIKQTALELITKTLAGNNPARPVNVSAYGSQSSWGDGQVSNTLSITIT